MVSKINQETTLDTGEVLKEIGRRVKAYRKTKFNNYEKFAKACQLSKMTITRIERGENLHMDTLIQILRFLNVSIEDLFKGII